MKIVVPLLLVFLICQSTSAQTINQLSATSEFVCISGNPNLVGRLTKLGYHLVSEGSAKDSIRKSKDTLQANIEPLKNVLKEVSKGKQPKKGETTAINKILKGIGDNRLDGDKSTKMAVLNQAISIVKGLVALKKLELTTLSDCVHNKHNASIPAGSSIPRIVVLRVAGGEGIAVFGAVERDSRIYPPGAYCAKKNAEPAFEATLSTNPCPSGIQGLKACTGLLGANKVGFSVGHGAIYSSPPGEATIQSLIGQASQEVASDVYQIRSGQAGKTCGQTFGE